MSKKLVLVLVLALTAASSFADDAIRRTVVVRDGQVILDDGEPFGKRPFLGVSVLDMTPDLREYFGAPSEAGVLVSSLADNGPAAKAGVRVGDVITAVNGKAVSGSWDLVTAMRDKHAGDSIRLDVIRGKARQTIVATAEEREMPGPLRKFALDELQQGLGKEITAPEWKARLKAPETEELRTRIHELEIRLQELEKKLQK